MELDDPHWGQDDPPSHLRVSLSKFPADVRLATAPHDANAEVRPLADRRARRWPVLAGLVLWAAVAPVHAEWLIDIDAGALYDNNLTRAQDPVDIRADGAGTIAIAARSLIAVGGFDSVTLGAEARAEAYNRYHGIDNVAIGGDAVYRHKFGLGFDAPWVIASATGSYNDYKDNLRDGGRFALRAAVGKRFDEAADASVGVFYDRRYAPNGEPVVPDISGKVFNLRGRGAYVTAGYALTEQLLLGATASVRRGDVVSTTSPGDEIFAATDAIALDPAFGDNLYAYRLQGTTRTATVTASWALSDRSSINLLYADERTRVGYDLDYRSHAVNLTFAYRY